MENLFSENKDFIGFNGEKKEATPVTPVDHSRKRKRSPDSTPRTGNKQLGVKDLFHSSPWWTNEIRKQYSGNKPLIKVFHDEIIEFVKYIKPTPEEIRGRNIVIYAIRDLISRLWNRATIRVFGSYETEMMLPTSDVDIVVFNDVANIKNALHKLADAVRRSKLGVSLQVISRARVRIYAFNNQGSHSEIQGYAIWVPRRC
jgi:non-canonical poly(A) RNA polymerase PAPD5/7